MPFDITDINEPEEEESDGYGHDSASIDMLVGQQDVASGQHMPRNVLRPDLSIDPRVASFSKNAIGLLDVPSGNLDYEYRSLADGSDKIDENIVTLLGGDGPLSLPPINNLDNEADGPDEALADEEPDLKGILSDLVRQLESFNCHNYSDKIIKLCDDTTTDDTTADDTTTDDTTTEDTTTEDTTTEDTTTDPLPGQDYYSYQDCERDIFGDCIDVDEPELSFDEWFGQEYKKNPGGTAMWTDPKTGEERSIKLELRRDEDLPDESTVTKRSGCTTINWTSDNRWGDGLNFHVAKKGDTISCIAYTYGLSIPAIKSYNPKVSTEEYEDLKPGLPIFIVPYEERGFVADALQGVRDSDEGERVRIKEFLEDLRKEEAKWHRPQKTDSIPDNIVFDAYDQLYAQKRSDAQEEINRERSTSPMGGGSTLAYNFSLLKTNQYEGRIAGWTTAIENIGYTDNESPGAGFQFKSTDVSSKIVILEPIYKYKMKPLSEEEKTSIKEQVRSGKKPEELVLPESMELVNGEIVFKRLVQVDGFREHEFDYPRLRTLLLSYAALNREFDMRWSPAEGQSWIPDGLPAASQGSLGGARNRYQMKYRSDSADDSSGWFLDPGPYSKEGAIACSEDEQEDIWSIGAGSVETGLLSFPENIDLEHPTYLYQIQAIRDISCNKTLSKEQKFLGGLIAFGAIQGHPTFGKHRNIQDKNRGKPYWPDSPINHFYKEYKRLSAIIVMGLYNKWGFIPRGAAEEDKYNVGPNDIVDLPSGKYGGRLLVRKNGSKIQAINVSAHDLADKEGTFKTAEKFYFNWRKL